MPTTPEPRTELTPPRPQSLSDPQVQARVQALAAQIDLNETPSVLFFGAKAQEQLTRVSDTMLEGVRSKDSGAAGAALAEMVTAIKGFDAGALQGQEKPGFFARMMGKAKPVAKLLQQYEAVREQIDTIGDELERHKTGLLQDIVSLDRLYEATLEYFHELELYIAAGEDKLRELDSDTIPALEREAAESGDVLKAQELRDLRTLRDELERRVHDLKLTRQVTMQALPSIRLVQENDKGLVNKISSTLVNTVPLWRQQLAQAVTIHRSQEAARTLKSATDLTNELLEANAQNLQQANREARQQMERGVFDIEVVKRANRTLIDTIEESLAIADEGRRRRGEAARELQACEEELRRSLSAASAREQEQLGRKST